MKNILKDITKYIKVKITEVGFVDPQGLQGILILTAKDGRNIPITAFSGEVAQHIKRFINGDRTSLPTIYKLVEELAEYNYMLLTKIEIYNKESKNGKVLGAYVQFGGQTPLKIAKEIENAGVKILGTTTEAIDLAEDRDRFSKTLNSLNILQPLNGFARSIEKALKIAVYRDLIELEDKVPS